MPTEEDICEAAYKIKRYAAIRDGKREMITKKVYDDVPDGYKIVDGERVRMTPEEMRNRSKAATISSNKSSTKRNRDTSTRRRKILVR